ncbi:MAG: DUF853 domain-containing protein [Gemmatimonadota bacterium]|nr:DUF853 domain-containing protein [Gemmatimonadota bacterium]
MTETLESTLRAGYGFTDPAIVLGAALADGACIREPKVRLPLAMMTRHGVIAGATGTGKTKTLQLLTEQLSRAGVPVFVADIKGDLSGLAMPGEPGERVASRAADVGWTWTPEGVPVEFMSLSGSLGVQLRATVTEFGPLLLARALDLNDTQTSGLALLFRFADQAGLPILDIADLRSVLQHAASEPGKAALAEHGGVAPATVGVILRKLAEMETQGADRFFGEPQFDVRDLLGKTSDGRGVVTCLELSDVQDRPRLFSTAMMWLLAELYQNLPEAGDLDRPRLVFFFDEAHLLFADASRAFLEQVEQVVRLIRSKGVGIYFVTQTPRDIPDDILGQLGNRVQHALRAHTPDDEKDLRATVRTFPRTPHYDLEVTLTSLGVGEALVTGLDPRGVPTPVVAARLIPPSSRMGPLSQAELAEDIRQSDFTVAYGKSVDRESAREMLARRLAEPAQPAIGADSSPRGPGMSTAAKVGTAMVAALGTTVARSLGRELIRGVFGMLGAKPPRRTTRRRW